jgi:dihydropteroate synthase
MPAIACGASVGVCAMHMQGTPQTMQDGPTYTDVVENVHAYLAARRDALVALGIPRPRLCLDPGIGFGKSHQHNLDLLVHCDRYLDLGCAVLIGHSRKGFLGKIIGDKLADRTAATVGVSLALAAKQIQVLRVHDVRPVREALLSFAASGGL